MEQFRPVFRGRPWSADRLGPGMGARALHVYAVPDLSVDRDLAALVAGCREAMAGHPILPAPDEFLHLTLDMVSARYSDLIGAADRARLTAALQARLAHTDAFTVTLGSPLAGRAGALLDIHPDTDVDALHHRIRETVDAVVPSDLHHLVPPVHMSLGYSYDSGDSDRLQSALRRVRPGHATMTVTGVQLVDVLFRQVPAPGGRRAWELSWNTLATIPLRSASCN
ncbi:2'-5' RNA ligase family protein [Kitasatospora sp. NPDC088134]|uniref:2'-5' RNA ligase family protein n=1 Tax=Kitasatospora sp. NPDC088134 TaxID=3364071 RepID=UPI0038251CD9